jgi:hypothetical protein
MWKKPLNQIMSCFLESETVSWFGKGVYVCLARWRGSDGYGARVEKKLVNFFCREGII